MSYTNGTRKLALAGLLTAGAVVGGMFSIPLGAAKCSPVQHMVNVIAAILLGPGYAVGSAFTASIIRNLIGTGSLLAFPGSMVGALLAGLLYRKTHHLAGAFVGEVVGTGILGAMLSYPVATLLMGKSAALFAFVPAFMINTVAGSIVAVLVHWSAPMFCVTCVQAYDKRRFYMKFEKEMLTLYAVTDQTWLNGRTLAEVVEQVIRGGVTMVQLREKGQSADEMMQTAREVQAVCRKYNVPFIVNDSIELARKLGADGVHLGQSDVPEGDVRKMTEGLILGMSANTIESAQRAAAKGADYLGVGAVFGTMTKHDARHLSPQKLREITGSVDIPVVAIGGINRENILELSGCGMEGAAVVSALFAQENPEQAAREMREKAEQMK